MTPLDEDLRRAAAAAFREGFGGVIRIEPDGARPFWVDGRGEAPIIAESEPPGLHEAGCCRWFAAPAALLRLFEEQRSLGPSFISGRLSVVGDMSVMARLKLGGPHD
jgi:hypothetical protein